MTTATHRPTPGETHALAQLRRALGQPVDRERADELEELARSVGARITWINVNLTTGQRSEGRATNGMSTPQP